MISAPNPELSQLVDTFRALTEEDLTEPLLPKMRTLIGNLERHCSPAEQPPRHSYAADAEYASRSPDPNRSGIGHLLLDRLHFL